MKLILIAGMCICVPAMAYLDPGSGSLIVQIIIGTMAAAAGTFRFWWGRLRRKNKDAKTSEKPPTSRTGT